MENVFVLAAVAGAVELIKRLQARDYWAALTILVSAAIGSLAGFFGIGGISVTTGLVLGLGASGLVTVAQKVGEGK